MNSILFHFQVEISVMINSDRTDLPQNGLQKYTFLWKIHYWIKKKLIFSTIA